MRLVPWYYKAGAGLLVLAGYTAFIWHLGGQSERLDAANKDNKTLAAAVAERDKAIADRNQAQRKADELAKLPPKVVTVVRNNPSSCVLPRPVTDSVRDQVRETNSAIRSVR